MARLELEERVRLNTILRAMRPERLVELLDDYEVVAQSLRTRPVLSATCKRTSDAHRPPNFPEDVDLGPIGEGEPLSVAQLVLLLCGHERECHS